MTNIATGYPKHADRPVKQFAWDGDQQTIKNKPL